MINDFEFYAVQYNNGEWYEDYEQYTVYFPTLEQAKAFVPKNEEYTTYQLEFITKYSGNSEKITPTDMWQWSTENNWEHFTKS